MLYLFNTTVIPQGAFGAWEISPVSLPDAQAIIRRECWISAIGHASTAEVMSSLLETDVQMNRIQVRPAPGDQFLCFRLLQRAPEGAILNREEIEAIGYEWALMRYVG